MCSHRILKIPSFTVTLFHILTMLPNYCFICCHAKDRIHYGLMVVLLDCACYRRTHSMFRFSTTIFYGGFPGFATDCHCGVWCRGLTTCLLHVGRFFGNLAPQNHHCAHCLKALNTWNACPIYYVEYMCVCVEYELYSRHYLWCDSCGCVLSPNPFRFWWGFCHRTFV